MLSEVHPGFGEIGQCITFLRAFIPFDAALRNLSAVEHNVLHYMHCVRYGIV